ncbi:hypothetical protein F5888DRAFT_1906711 [Russula emetica]|nr:hypothetical protein F5888DRAFT_1906711 [Russula emetica]
MPFSRLLRTSSHSTLADSDPADAGGSTSDHSSLHWRGWQASGSKATIRHRHWKAKGPSTTDHSSRSQSTPIPPSTESRVVTLPIPDPAIPSVHPNRVAVPSPERIPAIGAVPDRLAEAWDAVKDGPKFADTRRALPSHDVDDMLDTSQISAAPYIPFFKATVIAAEKTKAVKDGIDKFTEYMPILMKALDELTALHPFIGVVVLAFKKIISLFIGMKDMMGVLLLLKNMENDKLIAPDGINIEDHLKSLVERTADDIKECSNVCDTYMKKRPLARLLLSSLWDSKLLEFVELFATRRQEFEFELTVRTSRGVDKAHVKLDAINEQFAHIYLYPRGALILGDRMNAVKALFERLVDPEQKQLLDLVNAKGGVEVLRNDDKILLDLEKTVSKGSGPPSVEGLRARQIKSVNTDPEVEDLRVDILEDPNAAAEKNWVMFSRKFEAQKNQIIDELALVVQHEGDRVIRELKGKAHERILNRLIHDLWVEMGWRGNVKARHFVLALRDNYLEKLSSETKGVLDMSTSSINDSTNPDGWAIKYIDIMWVQPILEAFDDDASGFITITEVNRFTSSRPVNWSLPHWLAFWAVGESNIPFHSTLHPMIAGFKLSIIDYARKIEELFAKMEGVRSVVLPPNREVIDGYFGYVWRAVHTLTAAVLSQSSSQSSGSDDLKNFKSYLEAEEARLGNNLRAVDYIIDGIDTIPLIAGVGRIEKAVFPLLYLLMKRHYEIMRVMRTKVLNMRELVEGAQGIMYIHSTIVYRVQDLKHNFSQQRLDPEKQLQSFAFGIFKYCHMENTLLSVNYIRCLDSQIIPYNDDNEDQTVQPEDILNHEYRDKLSLDYSVYDGRPMATHYLPNCRDVGSPVKDILGHWNGYSYDRKGVHWGAQSMMTFVLEPAEGEHDFKADVCSLQGRQTIVGSWSKGEDDVLQIKFKMSFSSASVLWASLFFSGRFDPERDALTGIWGLSAELKSPKGKMEFRRILPSYLTLYPSIKEIRDNKPRALWRFAIAAVRNDIRRGRWAWSYFSRRRDDRKTIVPLLVRSRWFGPPLSAEEIRTLHAITRRLTPADASFYDSKVDHIRAHTWVHEHVTCDSCSGLIGGPRLFCLDCAIKSTELYDSLDLCCAPKCVAARVTHRRDVEGAHEPNHRLVKVRTTVLLRSHGRVHTAACNAFERVGETCRRVAEFTLRPDGETRPDRRKPLESASTKMSAKTFKLDDIPNRLDGSKGGAGLGGKAVREARQVQVLDQSLPTCGKCKGRLSFPF